MLARADSLLQREEQINRVLRLLMRHKGLTPPAVLLAKSGSGKSTFVAQLVSRLREQIQSVSSVVTAHFDVVHSVFVGSTAGSTSLYRVLRELCTTLKADLPDEVDRVVPDDILSLGSLLAHFLNALADAGKRVLLCVDAVNELEGPVARSLSWLPTHSKATLLITRCAPPLPPNTHSSSVCMHTFWPPIPASAIITTHKYTPHTHTHTHTHTCKRTRTRTRAHAHMRTRLCSIAGGENGNDSAVLDILTALKRRFGLDTTQATTSDASATAITTADSTTISVLPANQRWKL